MKVLKQFFFCVFALTIGMHAVAHADSEINYDGYTRLQKASVADLEKIYQAGKMVIGSAGGHIFQQCVIQAVRLKNSSVEITFSIQGETKQVKVSVKNLWTYGRPVWIHPRTDRISLWEYHSKAPEEKIFLRVQQEDRQFFLTSLAILHGTQESICK